MQELDIPAVPSLLDLRDQLRAVRAASRTASDRRSVIESEIRTATSIPRLAELHELWQDTIEQLDAAMIRHRELLELLGTAN